MKKAPKSKQVGVASGYPLYKNLKTNTFFCPAFTYTKDGSMIFEGYKTLASIRKAVDRKVEQWIDMMI